MTKSIIAEITDDSNIATAFGLFNITWALGSILGPVVGGLLNQPTTRLAPIFGGISFLAEYPYFLPCFVSSLVSIAGFVVGIFWLPETMHSFHVDPIFLDEEANLLSNTDGQASLIMNEANLVVPLDVQSATSGAQKESMAIAETRPAISRLASVLSYDHIRDRRLDAAYLSGSSAIRRRTSSSVGAYMYENPQTRQSSSHRSIFHLPDASDFITSRSGAISDYAAVSAMLDRGIGSIGRFSVQSIDSRPDGGVSSSLPTAANLLRSSSSSSPRYSSFRASLQTTAETPKNAQTHPNAEIPNSPLAHVADIETEEFAEIVLNPGGLSIDTIKTIFAYSFLALGNAIIDEIYNLWTVEPPRLGGLGFNSVHIGVTLAAVGLFDVLFQVYAYGPCQKMLGCVRLFQVSIFVYGPAVAMLPFVPLLLTAIPWENTGAMDLFDSFPTAAKALTLSVLLVLLMIKCVCQLFGYTAVMIMVLKRERGTSHTLRSTTPPLLTTLAWLTESVKQARPLHGRLVLLWLVHSGLGRYKTTSPSRSINISYFFWFSEFSRWQHCKVRFSQLASTTNSTGLHIRRS